MVSHAVAVSGYLALDFGWPPIFQVVSLYQAVECIALPVIGYFRTDLVALNLFNVTLGSCMESHEFWINFLSRRSLCLRLYSFDRLRNVQQVMHKRCNAFKFQ